MAHRRFAALRDAARLAGLAILTMPWGGCSNDQVPTYPVRGRVEFPDREPIRTGIVELQSLEAGLNARGNIARDGSFVLGTYASDDGAIAGEHRAIVVQLFAVDSIQDTDIVHDHGDAVDPKYADYATSGLTFEIEPKENVLRIVVERAANPPAAP